MSTDHATPERSIALMIARGVIKEVAKRDAHHTLPV
jgi:hypothetical protein